MKRTRGNKGIELLGKISVNPVKYRIRWDIQPHFNDEGEEQGVSFMEAETLYKPNIEQVKNIVLNGYNQIIGERILSGFVWKDMSVWLSSENQFNYKAAYDLAVMSQGKTLPTVFKFGTTENPVYYTFETLDDISDFYVSAMAYINKCLAEGWRMKDEIDWSEYQKYL